MKKLLALIIAIISVFTVTFTVTACGNGGGSGSESNNEVPDDNENNDNNENNENSNDEDDSHECTYATTWSYDSQNHWHASTCTQHRDRKSDVAPHEYENGECNVCGRGEVYGVGNKLPDFTVDTFISSYKEGTFSSESARGKVLVINFWYVSCGPCISEMPEIEQVKQDYGDDVVVIALHASGSEHATDLAVAQNKINNEGWSDYGIIFGKDLDNDALYKMIGGDGYYPKTLVLDKEGVITAKIDGNIMRFDMDTYQYTNLLVPEVEAALNK